MNLDHPPLWLWIVLAVLLFSQGMWLFNDATKRGRRAWFWGLLGIMNCPTPLIVYWLVVVWPDRRTRTKL